MAYPKIISLIDERIAWLHELRMQIAAVSVTNSVLNSSVDGASTLHAAQSERPEAGALSADVPVAENTVVSPGVVSQGTVQAAQGPVSQHANVSIRVPGRKTVRREPRGFRRVFETRREDEQAGRKTVTAQKASTALSGTLPNQPVFVAAAMVRQQESQKQETANRSTEEPLTVESLSRNWLQGY